MQRCRLALAGWMAALTVLQGVGTSNAGGFGNSSRCGSDHEYRICGAWYATATWWGRPGLAAASYPQLAADRRHSEGCGQALALNAANDAVTKAPAVCSYTHLAADPRHTAGCQTVLDLNRAQEGSCGGHGSSQQARVSQNATDGSRVLAEHEASWHACGMPTWCGCDIAWFDSQGASAADATQQHAPAEEGRLGAAGVQPPLPVVLAALGRPAAKAAHAWFDGWRGVCRSLYSRLAGLEHAIDLLGTPELLGRSAAPADGAGSEPLTFPAPARVPPSAYLGL
jgi:hypothetical protein